MLRDAKAIEIVDSLDHDFAKFDGNRSLAAFDTAGAAMVQRIDNHNSLKLMSARFLWPCDDPSELEAWGLRLLDSRTIAQPQPAVRAGLPLAFRAQLSALGLVPQVKTCSGSACR